MDKKHKLVIAACIAAILLLVGVSAGIYGNYIYQHIHELQAKANHSAQVSEAQAKKEAKAKADFNYQLYLLDLNCQKDINNTQAAKKPLPVCDSHLTLQ